MNIKRALTFIAIGFTLTAMDYELSIFGTSFDLFPDFVGFLLLYLAYRNLGDYVKDQKYLKWCALTLTFFSAAVWIAEIVRLTDNETIDGVCNAIYQSLSIVSGVYFFLLFGVLEMIATDYDVPQKKSLHLLKFINFGAAVLISFTAFLTELAPIGVIAILVLLIGLVAIVASVITMAVLIRFVMALDVNKA